MDLMLDIVVEPGLTWRMKDEEEFNEIVERGIYDSDLAARIRAEAASVIERIEARRSPFDEPWPEWAPAPEWLPPVLPAEWARVPEHADSTYTIE